jgi:hypothetical protein
MEQKNYHCSINAAVTPAEALAGIANVSGWWAKNFKGSATTIGDKFKVQFGETWVDFEIIEVVPEKRIVWKVTDCYLHWLNDKTEWTNTTIIWEISAIDKITQIDMTHVGLVPGIECYEDCNKGWTGHLTKSLPKLLTEGVGHPE